MSLLRQEDWFDSSEKECSEDFSIMPLTVRGVAAEIDTLERHIEHYGSIVPKHADVWGQARLMMHRNEFERVMRQDVNTFNATLQATISTRDQAYLADAFALQAAAKGSSPGTLPDVTTMVSDPDKVIVRNEQLPRASMTGPNGLTLEPEIIEDQKKRYLKHLHELRRINEGDDNTDAPGYSLNLVRIPISVLAGQHTKTGWGAECTVTAVPYLPDDLLPTTFRTLVANDLAGLLTLPITRIIDTQKDGALADLLVEYEAARQIRPILPAAMILKSRYRYVKLPEHGKLKDLLGDKEVEKLRDKDKEGLSPEALREYERLDQPGQGFIDESNRIFYRVSSAISGATPVSQRRAKDAPMPPSQIAMIFGAHNLAYLAQHVRKQLGHHFAASDHAYHLDVQASLRTELGAAYDFLKRPECNNLWEYCSPGLADAVRNQDMSTVIQIQEAFFATIEDIGKKTYFITPDLKLRRTATAILAWAIIIDSALLNEKFADEIKATHVARGGPPAPPTGIFFYQPEPGCEMCKLFNDFVMARWPLHVFALDPETQDQNVGDSFSKRREMQFAMSLAFTSGQMNASNFMRYVRRIEQDIDTIAINHTMVGFSHGDNVFGWRFYPRVQTPPINGNFEAIFRDLLVGGQGPSYYLRRRQLENGIRECDALVIMPSFVPYVDLSVTANWFRLADPKCKLLNMKQTMRLSHQVKCIQERVRSLCDHGEYRAGDVTLMAQRVEQLSARLPLQSQQVGVPYENTHGGFELLSKGVTDLAPELIGWYGAPGINPKAHTALFLVGDNFSVHQTRVIVGGRMLDPNMPLKKHPDDPTDSKDTTQDNTQAAKLTNTKTKSAPTKKTPSQEAGDGQEASAATGDGLVVQANWRTGLKHKPQGTQAAPVLKNLNIIANPTGGSSKSDNSKAPKSDGSTGGSSTGDSSKKSDKTKSADGTTDQKKSDKPTNGSSDKQDSGSGQPTGGTTGAETFEIYQVELLSRQVMRIVIPPGVYSVNGMVDVQIATPYGVSPAVQVPVHKDEEDKPKPQSTEGYSVPEGQNGMTIHYRVDPKNNNFSLSQIPVPFAMQWTDATGSTLRTLEVTVSFKLNGKPIEVAPMRLELNHGSIKVPDFEATAFARDLLGKLSDKKILKLEELPEELASASISVTPIDTGAPAVHDEITVKASGTITVHFVRDY
jgi:hypothetical protein